jgi:hypothetical protein
VGAAAPRHFRLIGATLRPTPASASRVVRRAAVRSTQQQPPNRRILEQGRTTVRRAARKRGCLRRLYLRCSVRLPAATDPRSGLRSYRRRRCAPRACSEDAAPVGRAQDDEVSYASIACHIFHYVHDSGRSGRIGRSGCCHERPGYRRNGAGTSWTPRGPVLLFAQSASGLARRCSSCGCLRTLAASDVASWVSSESGLQGRRRSRDCASGGRRAMSCRGVTVANPSALSPTRRRWRVVRRYRRCGRSAQQLPKPAGLRGPVDAWWPAAL